MATCYAWYSSAAQHLPVSGPWHAQGSIQTLLTSGGFQLAIWLPSLLSCMQFPVCCAACILQMIMHAMACLVAVLVHERAASCRVLPLNDGLEVCVRDVVL